MLLIFTHLWPLFYTGKARMIALVGVRPYNLGPTHATNFDGQPRSEPIFITRVAFTCVSELEPSDHSQCGLLGHGELLKELTGQKPDLLDDNPVTLVSFRRRTEVPS